jgi:2-polyprenyl-3-methyl-5-hydroxy-6-metoxy-1,4-benzoquinol methylase
MNQSRPLNSQGLPLTKRDFYRFVDGYVPLPFEYAELRNGRIISNAYCYRKRFFLTLRSALKRLHTGAPAILDIGCYPGSVLRLLRQLLSRRGLTPSLHGVGLMTGDEFKRLMRADCGVIITEVNLDPRNPDLQEIGYPSKIPLPDGSIDVVIATEIIEHLMDPTLLIREAFRLLQPGGSLVVTTPNITRAGSLFKLLVGRTNLDHLMPPGYTNRKDLWRPHFREYAMDELQALLTARGFSITESFFYVDGSDEVAITTRRQRLINACKIPMYLVPHFRDNLLVVASKPA